MAVRLATPEQSGQSLEMAATAAVHRMRVCVLNNAAVRMPKESLP